MPRLCALLLLAGIAAAALPRRRLPLTPEQVALLRLPSPSRSVH